MAMQSSRRLAESDFIDKLDSMVFILFLILSFPLTYAQSINPGDELENCDEGKVDIRYGSSRDRSDRPKNQIQSEIRLNGKLSQNCRLIFNTSIEQRKFTVIGDEYRDDSHFFGARAGVGTFWLLKSGFIFAGISATYRVETDSGVSQILPVGYVLAGNKMSSKLTWLYGIAYSDPLGKAQPLPILGANVSWADRWSTRFLLPLSVTTTWNQNPYRKLRLIASAFGFQSKLENRGRFDSNRNEVRGRFRAFKLSGAYDVGISESTDLVFELGVLAARRYEVLSGNDSLYVENLHPASYAQIGLIKHF
jgi:hypothetical protein